MMSTHRRGVAPFLPTVAGLLGTLSLSVGIVNGQGLPAGDDCWSTQPGSTFTIPPIPADFFGPGSDPFPGEAIDVLGLPVPAATCNCQDTMPMGWNEPHSDPGEPGNMLIQTHVPGTSGPYDTCIQRLEDELFGGGVGVPDTIEIELVALSLQSVSPITVTFGSGPAAQFDVSFTLETAPSAGDDMELTALELGAGLRGTMVLQPIPIQYRIEFLPPAPSDAAPLGRAIALPGVNAVLQNNDGFFGLRRVPVPTLTEGALWLLAALIAGAGIVRLIR